MARPKPLTDLQLVLLSHAAKTDAGSLFPLPASITDDERVRSELSALLKRKLVAECEQPGTSPAWRGNDDRWIGLVLTDTGRTALGLGEGKETTPLAMTPTGDKVVDPTPVATPPPAPARAGTKRDLVASLLSRPEGATLAEITDATGWQPHSARAVLTGLRKQGHELIKSKRGDTTVYTIAEVGADAVANAVTDADAGAASARSTAGASA